MQINFPQLMIHPLLTSEMDCYSFFLQLTSDFCLHFRLSTLILITFLNRRLLMSRLFLFFYLFLIQGAYGDCNAAGNYSVLNSGILQKSLVSKSVLSSGSWVKVQVNQGGIHKITFASLKSMGFQSPQKVKIFGFPQGPLPQMNNIPAPDDLIKYAVWQTKDKQANDCWLINIPGPVTWIEDAASGLFTPVINQFAQGHAFFYLTENEDVINSVPLLSSKPENSTVTVTGFDDFALYEESNYNLIMSGSGWYSALLTPNGTLTRAFKFPGHIDAEPFNISVAAAGRCDLPSSLDIVVNNTLAGNLSFSPYSNFAEADYANLNKVTIQKTISGSDLSFLLKFNGSNNNNCWIDYIRVQTRSKLNFLSGQLPFCDSRSVGPGSIAEFHIGNAPPGLKIWDISSPLEPLEMQTVLTNGICSFKVATDSLHRYIAFDPFFDFPGVEQPEVIANQDLHALPVPDMLILTTADFNAEAQRLAGFHLQDSGMDVAVVDVSQIYNEFSGGVGDVTAIRNFVRLLYRNGSTGDASKLKYLVLLGKGTYDNLHPVSIQNPCFIPTWQSENSNNPVSSFVSDDFFGLLGADEGGQTGITAIGIGRIPCATALQAKAAVDKIIHYNTAPTLGDWRNVICFVGDDLDNNVHVSDSEHLADFLNLNYPAFYTDKIYLDAFQEVTTPTLAYPDVNKAITNRIKEGALIVNYVGHANEEEWAAEKVLTISDIDSWSNLNKLPVFVTATCEFSRWDMTGKESAGEHVLFNPVGGGVALFSTTRMVYSSSNFELNKSFFKYVFKKDSQGNNLRMGDVIRLAKRELGGTINASKFALLGDPAQQISYPKYIVRTLEINSQVAEQMTDTIRPLSLVSVWGEIQDTKGVRMTGYNGTLSPNVFDKPSELTTLGNNGQVPFTYSLQNSLLFKGNISVKQGEFNYTFEIPKEINYRIGDGMIRNYSKDATTDANGSLTTFKLGGSPMTLLNDITGPVVKLFLDNENFRDGDKVSKAPLLLVNLEDDSGINTSGGGIGHDISLIIDGKEVEIIYLNNYFQAGLDSYKSGKVLYQLPELSDGQHTLRFKVWDLANNSTEVVVRFNVASALSIKKVTNFPNPFSEYTDFIVEYNRYDEKVTIIIEIFNQQGSKVDQIKTDAATSGFTTQPVRWSPGGSNQRLASGIYYYRILLTTADDSTDSETGQLIYNHL